MKISSLQSKGLPRSVYFAVQTGSATGARNASQEHDNVKYENSRELTDAADESRAQETTGQGASDATSPLSTTRMRRMPRYLRAVVEMIKKVGYRDDLLELVQAELQKRRPADSDPLIRSPAFSIPAEGSWSAEAWIGLSTSCVPEAVPEEVLVAIALRQWLSRQGVTRARASGPGHGRVLDWGAPDSHLALALLGTRPSGHTVKIDSIGPEGASAPWERRLASFPRNERYDLVFLHPPAASARAFGPPCAANDHHEVYAQDLARADPDTWRMRLFDVVRTAGSLVAPAGEMVLFLPTEVRGGGRPHRRARWGYMRRRGLLDGARELLTQLHLEVTTDVTVHEHNGVTQPLCRHNTCVWRLVIARRPTEESGGSVTKENRNLEASGT
jgi:hypothetical protein